jgi:hypothetical protein
VGGDGTGRAITRAASSPVLVRPPAATPDDRYAAPDPPHARAVRGGHGLDLAPRRACRPRRRPARPPRAGGGCARPQVHPGKGALGPAVVRDQGGRRRGAVARSARARALHWPPQHGRRLRLELRAR